jgi:hypothetical protein
MSSGEALFFPRQQSDILLDNRAAEDRDKRTASRNDEDIGQGRLLVKSRT